MALKILTRSIGEACWMRAESGGDERWLDLRFRSVLLDLWCGDESVHGDSQVVGAGQIADGDAGGAGKVQYVSFFMGWKIHMLGEVEDV